MCKGVKGLDDGNNNDKKNDSDDDIIIVKTKKITKKLVKNKPTKQKVDF